jgi:predicted transcriptional regulator
MIFGMSLRKVRVTITLSRDIVERVDRFAANASRSRSGVIDEWLRRAARGQAISDLDSAIAAYYETQSPVEEKEVREWARFSTRSFFARESRSMREMAPARRTWKTRRR